MTKITEHDLYFLKIARQLGKDYLKERIKYYDDLEATYGGLHNVEETFRDDYQEWLWILEKYEGIDLNELEGE